MRDDAYKDYTWNTHERAIVRPGFYAVRMCNEYSVVCVHRNQTVTGTHLPMNSLKGLNMNIFIHKGVWKKLEL